jgi:opacity protein-like surface antigen
MFGKFEYALSDHIGLGFNVAYVYGEVSAPTYLGSPFTEKDAFTSLSYLVRFNYHMLNHDVIDLYVGGGLGYRTGKWEYTTNDPNSSSSYNQADYFPFGAEITFGSRFLVVPDVLGVYIEVGLAKAVMQFGIVGKI